MREIKFRGKHIHAMQQNEHLNGTWVYGFLCDKNYINTGEAEKLIDESTVGQFTGLHDKNGKEIYEGDIVECFSKRDETSFHAVVEFGNPNGEYDWGFQLRHIKGDNPNMEILLWVGMEEVEVYTEIVGNIYENSDLIES